MPTAEPIITAKTLPSIVGMRLGNAPYTLVIKYDDGAEMVTDMTGIIHKRQALAALHDQDEFSKVRVINNGDGVAWEAGPDFSADALRHLAEVQRDMTGHDFKAWMKRLGISNNEAADVLGVSARTIKAYKANQGTLPSRVGIACKALERNLTILHARFRPRKLGRPKND
ncbi:MAG: DUF2442 domain-containing protein [Rhodospirillales bacterium]